MKRALIYGGLVALASVVWLLLEHALGFRGENIETGQYTGYVAMLFPIIGIVMAIWSAKRADPGPFSFGDGFKLGLAVTAVSAVLGAIFFYIYVTALNPDYAQTLQAATEAQLQKQGLSGRELEQAQSMQAGLTSPAALSIFSLFGSVLVGLVVSAVVAAIMRRKEQPSSGDGYGG